MTARISAWFAFLIAFAPAIAFAHPGHGHTDPSSWRHYVVEPAHAVLLAVAIAAVVVGIATFVVPGWRRSRADSR